MESEIKDSPISEPRAIFETKYISPIRFRERIISVLRQRTLVPKEFAEAKVKTVYFDDRSNTSFDESLDGHITKEKYRLREYLDSDGGAKYSLEIKLRNDKETSKIRKLIFKGLPEGYRFTTFRELLHRFEADNDFSLSRLRTALPRTELYADTTIYYERFRFDDPYADFRLNLDTNIELLPPTGSERGLRSGVVLPHDIFEIKSSMPVIFPHYLRGLSIEPGSFSKFVWGKDLFL